MKINLRRVNFVNVHSAGKLKENKKMLKHGSYSIALTALVIAIVVILNLVIQELRQSIESLT